MDPKDYKNLEDYKNMVEENHFEKVALEKLKCRVRGMISKRQLEGAFDCFTFVDHKADSLVLEIESEILGKELPELRFPTNWKEALKERFLPQFLKKKFPVKYCVVNIRVLYPYIPIPDRDYSFNLSMNYEKAKRPIEEEKCKDFKRQIKNKNSEAYFNRDK